MIDKTTKWRIQSFPNGQVDITNGEIVFNIHPTPNPITPMGRFAGMTDDQIDAIKYEYADWVKEIINRSLI